MPSSDHSCKQCGHALESNEQSICGQCQTHPPYFDQTICYTRYQDVSQELILQMKFQKQLIVADTLGRCLLTKIKRNQSIPKPELLIPVPMHSKRLRERGFNQALEITKTLSKSLHIPFDTKHVIRQRYTPAQTTLQAQARYSNPKDSFRLKKPLNMKSIAIVDDVVTTGSTVNELSKLLKKQGVNHIQIWAFAHA